VLREGQGDRMAYKARARPSGKWHSFPGSGFWEFWGVSPEGEADLSLSSAEGGVQLSRGVTSRFTA